jgi:hypothetical protein
MWRQFPQLSSKNASFILKTPSSSPPVSPTRNPAVIATIGSDGTTHITLSTDLSPSNPTTGSARCAPNAFNHSLIRDVINSPSAPHEVLRQQSGQESHVSPQSVCFSECGSPSTVTAVSNDCTLGNCTHVSTGSSDGNPIPAKESPMKFHTFFAQPASDNQGIPSEEQRVSDWREIVSLHQ